MGSSSTDQNLGAAKYNADVNPENQNDCPWLELETTETAQIRAWADTLNAFIHTGNSYKTPSTLHASPPLCQTPPCRLCSGSTGCLKRLSLRLFPLNTKDSPSEELLSADFFRSEALHEEKASLWWFRGFIEECQHSSLTCRRQVWNSWHVWSSTWAETPSVRSVRWVRNAGFPHRRWCNALRFQTCGCRATWSDRIPQQLWGKWNTRTSQ